MGNRKKFRQDTKLDTYYETGVFADKVNGIVVGYFVGWRYRYGNAARNIREGLYFKTADEAKIFHASMERPRKNRFLLREHEQIV